jgi:zinc/manganese transport system permease protein/zinc transport system permease protein
MSLPEFLQLPQMQRAFVIALITGPVGGLLGAFVTLRRMAFFSDAISHGAMTGVTLGFALGIAREVGSPAMQGVLLVFCVGLALLMALLLERTTLHTDTVIAFSFTGSVALGVVVLSRLNAGARVLESALFGDILASSPLDVWLVAGLAVVTLAFLCGNMRALALSVVQESLARLQGFNMRRVNYQFVALIALVVAVLIRQMGALLVSGLLVIPAAAARLVARTFRGMLILSSVFGLVGGATGVVASYYCDTPTGPTIVLAHVAILALCLVWSWVFGERTQQWMTGGDLEKR